MTKKKSTLKMASFKAPADMLRFAKRRARATKKGFSGYMRELIEGDRRACARVAEAFNDVANGRDGGGEEEVA